MRHLRLGVLLLVGVLCAVLLAHVPSEWCTVTTFVVASAAPDVDSYEDEVVMVSAGEDEGGDEEADEYEDEEETTEEDEEEEEEAAAPPPPAAKSQQQQQQSKHKRQEEVPDDDDEFESSSSPTPISSVVNKQQQQTTTADAPRSATERPRTGRSAADRKGGAAAVAAAKKSKAGAGASTSNASVMEDPLAITVYGYRLGSLEIGVVGVFMLYIFLFFTGKHKNERLAAAWYESTKDVMEREFSLVGIEGSERKLTRDGFGTWHHYGSGREHVHRFLINLNFNDRYDALSTLAQLASGTPDNMSISASIPHIEAKPLVFAVMQRSQESKYREQYRDLAEFANKKNNFSIKGTDLIVLCDNRKSAVERIVNGQQQLFVALANHVTIIKYSDQEQFGLEKPSPTPGMFVRFGYALPSDEKELRRLAPLMLELTLNIIDRTASLKLSAEELRLAQEDRDQATLKERQKESAKKREERLQKEEAEREKREQERRKNMDRDELRKLEEKERKREIKKKMPRAKMLHM